MAVQSTFHKDLSKFEPVYRWGLTKRQLKMILGMIPGIIIIILEVFFITGYLFWIAAFLTAVLLIGPPVLKGTGKMDEMYNEMDFYFRIQDRYYQSGQIRRYTSDEFTPKKGIKEFDTRSSS
ncbi:MULTISPECIES: hypothetical protein [Lactococcus]|uniref:PrgI family protein n=2 Tax=Lactococcus TaxID=1357 RepID=A0AA46TVS8_9LACT|nr:MULTISPECIES: hypothetical protein [Lactococcus]MDC0826545.1 hypothetical protein [Lactococcus petauri]USJ19918.1 hypothetical protein LMK00_08775 [Lactococcus formosensis]UYT10293.1 hypothetical protein OF801_10175 [Lactococcus garvieae]UYT12360.1 hypothetical protein OF800_10310 [Lactococcus garvieae]